MLVLVEAQRFLDWFYLLVSYFPSTAISYLSLLSVFVHSLVASDAGRGDS